MIRHGPSCTMVARNASWPTKILTPTPQSGHRLICQSAKPGFIGYPNLLETIVLPAMASMLRNLRQPHRTIPKLFYP